MASSKYPYMSVNGEFFDKNFLDSAWEYLRQQAPIWQAGISAPTPADKLAYQVLKQISHHPGEPANA